MAQVGGTDRQQLTSAPDGAYATDYVERTVRWSPDGRFIAYVERLAGSTHSQIRLIASDGTGDRVLIESGTQPAWSPDGRFIAYTDIDASGMASYLYVADADGTNIRQISYPGLSTVGYIRDSYPVWSPDGRFIAFIRDRSLYMIRADGNDERFLTEAQPGLYMSSPSWEAQPVSVPVPTYTAVPTFTPTPAHIIATAVPANNAVGGGTGRILYGVGPSGPVYHLVDLNDRSISDVDLPGGARGCAVAGR